MKKQSTIIKNTVESPYMKEVAKSKGWTAQDAAHKVVAFLTCGKPISLFDYMENA